jgi:hypothetical protein
VFILKIKPLNISVPQKGGNQIRHGKKDVVPPLGGAAGLAPKGGTTNFSPPDDVHFAVSGLDHISHGHPSLDKARSPAIGDSVFFGFFVLADDQAVVSAGT